MILFDGLNEKAWAVYICICKGLTEQDIRSGVFRGEVACMDSLRERLGASTGCGSCELAAEDCLEEALTQKSRLQNAAPEEPPGDAPSTPFLSPEIGDFSTA